VSEENFAEEFAKVENQPASYVVDGIIDQATADSFFQ
jgi:hypothetical protein